MMTVEELTSLLTLILRVERDVYGTLRVSPTSIEEAVNKIVKRIPEK